MILTATEMAARIVDLRLALGARLVDGVLLYYSPERRCWCVKAFVAGDARIEFQDEATPDGALHSALKRLVTEVASLARKREEEAVQLRTILDKP